jgi:hypothetical protein
MQTLMRAVAGLLVISAIMNILYHSHLPTPLNDHILGRNPPGVVLRTPSSHSTIPIPSSPLNSTVTTPGTERNENSTIGNARAVLEEASSHTTTTMTSSSSSPPVNNSSIVWGSGAKAQQVVKTDKKGHVLHRSITQIKKEDLVGIGDDKVESETANLSLEEVKHGREELLAILRDAGVDDIDAESIAKLPTWKQVTALYGDKPVVYGLDTCQRFRDTIPKDDASIGTAGLFNTGTNP